MFERFPTKWCNRPAHIVKTEFSSFWLIEYIQDNYTLTIMIHDDNTEMGYAHEEFGSSISFPKNWSIS